MSSDIDGMGGVALDSRKIRLWPAWIILAGQLLLLILTITPAIDNVTRFGYMMLGPLGCFVLFMIWLCFGSRLPWRDRLIVLTSMVTMGLVAALLSHSSMRVGLWIYGIPLSMAIVTLGLSVQRIWPDRRGVRKIVLLLASGWLLFTTGRINGFAGDYLPELAWRWSPTHEQTLVAFEAERPGGSADVAHAARESWVPSAVQWPGFRGVGRNGRVSAWPTSLDWVARPPREIWRIPVGPAWSSFACVSGRLFTQEQRGEQEVVSCYNADDGTLVWRYEYPGRFSEVVSGPGPRATPTYADGRLFTMGAMGVVTALDASDGQLIWQHDLMAELNAPLPMWGFSGSPLVVEQEVIVPAGAEGGCGLVAYEVATGTPVWQVASRGMNFSSAQPLEFSGELLVAFADADGVQAIESASGKIAWQFTPSGWKGPAMVQVQQIGPRSLIATLGDGVGVVRIDVSSEVEPFRVEERWSSNKLKPSFNDFVYYQGFLYGFDQSIFVCVDAETGERKWKRGRYGFGQVILLESTAQLIVTTEAGEVVLLAADPSEHIELGRTAVLSGKTWNHPIVANGRLFLRNGEEAVCLELGDVDD